MRRHGASIRLYSNGVFHSQWNPERPFCGGVWDCLSLPVLYRASESLARAALLGVGGGAVLHQLAALLPDARLLGVELDPVHIEVATRWFDVSGDVLIEDDAVAWLESQADRSFDIIIDDLFGHDDSEPLRSVPLEFDWVTTLARTLSPDGLLIVNAATSRELKRAVPVFADAGFRYGKRWALPAYENAIGVLSRVPLHSRNWERALDTAPLSSATRRQARTCQSATLRGL